MMKKPVAYFFLLAQLIPGTVFAGDYKMVLGKGIEVCEAYLKNLNSFPKAPPMVCERKLNSKLPDFQKPKWEPLDTERHMVLLNQIWRHMLGHTEEQFAPLRERYITSVRGSVTKGIIVLAVTELDVDGDGIAEPVVRYDADVPCDPTNESNFSHPSGIRFFVLMGDRSKIDEKKTKWIGIGMRPDLLLYKREVFIDHWAGNLGFTGGLLKVNTPLALTGERAKVCKYEYQGGTAGRKP